MNLRDAILEAERIGAEGVERTVQLDQEHGGSYVRKLKLGWAPFCLDDVKQQDWRPTAVPTTLLRGTPDEIEMHIVGDAIMEVLLARVLEIQK